MFKNVSPFSVNKKQLTYIKLNHITRFYRWLRSFTNILHYHFIDAPSADSQLFISHSKTRFPASIYAQYQNRAHTRAAVIILVNQDHLMRLAAVL